MIKTENENQYKPKTKGVKSIFKTLASIAMAATMVISAGALTACDNQKGNSTQLPPTIELPNEEENNTPPELEQPNDIEQDNVTKILLLEYLNNKLNKLNDCKGYFSEFNMNKSYNFDILNSHINLTQKLSGEITKSENKNLENIKHGYLSGAFAIEMKDFFVPSFDKSETNVSYFDGAKTHVWGLNENDEYSYNEGLSAKSYNILNYLQKYMNNSSINDINIKVSDDNKSELLVYVEMPNADFDKLSQEEKEMFAHYTDFVNHELEIISVSQTFNFVIDKKSGNIENIKHAQTLDAKDELLRKKFSYGKVTLNIETTQTFENQNQLQEINHPPIPESNLNLER